MYLKEWGEARKLDALMFHNKDRKQQKEELNELFKAFFTSLLFVQHAS